jgi:ubiquinone/menaquinone biosynthesis C-methylase UbiE
LNNKSLLEIGGSLPNNLLFDHIGLLSYTAVESPDYIEADSGRAYSDRHGDHPSRNEIKCNAEDLDRYVSDDSIDQIFSVASFEHIYNLPKALEQCYRVSKRGGGLFSYFAPIYSNIKDGDHGVIPRRSGFPMLPLGFHLLSLADQRKALIEAGVNNPQEVQLCLGEVNFNRIPNRLLYEDYEKICTESPYIVLEIARQETYNLSKKYSAEFAAVRNSNPDIGNMFAFGFRVHLIKG